MIGTWPLAAATVLLAGLLDALFGEPPNALHPVAWLGRLIAALDRRCPRGGSRHELAWGVLLVAITVAVTAAVGVALALTLGHLPWWLALPLGAAALKIAFSLRGLVAAGHTVQRALETDTEAARAGLLALVSRSRDLETPQIASAAIESLAENLTDSVVAPLLYFALFGLPGALVYRAVNTMDAMVGYHGSYEHLGKPAARLDDVANWLPARLTGLLLVALAGVRQRGSAAWAALRTQRRRFVEPQQALDDRPHGRRPRRSAREARRLRRRPERAGAHRRDDRRGRRDGVAGRRRLSAAVVGTGRARGRQGLAMSSAPPGRIVMLQGTGSHAGKTVLVAALCRIYARRGLRVALPRPAPLRSRHFFRQDRSSNQATPPVPPAGGGQTS